MRPLQGCSRGGELSGMNNFLTGKQDVLVYNCFNVITDPNEMRRFTCGRLYNFYIKHVQNEVVIHVCSLMRAGQPFGLNYNDDCVLRPNEMKGLLIFISIIFVFNVSTYITQLIVTG